MNLDTSGVPQNDLAIENRSEEDTSNISTLPVLTSGKDMLMTNSSLEKSGELTSRGIVVNTFDKHHRFGKNAAELVKKDTSNDDETNNKSATLLDSKISTLSISSPISPDILAYRQAHRVKTRHVRGTVSFKPPKEKPQSIRPLSDAPLLQQALDKVESSVTSELENIQTKDAFSVPAYPVFTPDNSQSSEMLQSSFSSVEEPSRGLPRLSTVTKPKKADITARYRSALKEPAENAIISPAKSPNDTSFTSRKWQEPMSPASKVTASPDIGLRPREFLPLRTNKFSSPLSYIKTKEVHSNSDLSWMETFSSPFSASTRFDDDEDLPERSLVNRNSECFDEIKKSSALTKGDPVEMEDDVNNNEFVVHSRLGRSSKLPVGPPLTMTLSADDMSEVSLDDEDLWTPMPHHLDLGVSRSQSSAAKHLEDVSCKNESNCKNAQTVHGNTLLPSNEPEPRCIGDRGNDLVCERFAKSVSEISDIVNVKTPQPISKMTEKQAFPKTRTMAAMHASQPIFSKISSFETHPKIPVTRNFRVQLKSNDFLPLRKEADATASPVGRQKKKLNLKNLLEDKLTNTSSLSTDTHTNKDDSVKSGLTIECNKATVDKLPIIKAEFMENTPNLMISSDEGDTAPSYDNVTNFPEICQSKSSESLNDVDYIALHQDFTKTNSSQPFLLSKHSSDSYREDSHLLSSKPSLDLKSRQTQSPLKEMTIAQSDCPSSLDDVEIGTDFGFLTSDKSFVKLSATAQMHQPIFKSDNLEVSEHTALVNMKLQDSPALGEKESTKLNSGSSLPLQNKAEDNSILSNPSIYSRSPIQVKESEAIYSPTIQPQKAKIIPCKKKLSKTGLSPAKVAVKSIPFNNTDVQNLFAVLDRSGKAENK